MSDEDGARKPKAGPAPLSGCVTPLLGLVVGLFVFLRLPLDPARPYHPAGGALPAPPALPSAPARAAAAAPPAEAAAARAPHRRASLAPARRTGRYHPFAPAGASLQPLVAQHGPVADLLETRLDELEDLGLEEASTDVLYLLGAEQQAVAHYAAAAGFYEAFAAQDVCDVTCDERAPALENAVVLHRATGDVAGALRSADLFEARFETSSPRAATRVALTAAALDGRGGQDRLERLRRRRLPPAEAIQTEVALGRRLLPSDPRRARRAFRRAERLWRRSGGEHMATSPGLGPTEWVAELGRTREALAEARFLEAERRYRAAGRMAPPALGDELREAHVARWVRTELRPWLRRRMEAIDRAERALDRVDELGLSRQSVAAAARRGQLYQELADTLARVRLPSAVESDDESITLIEQPRGPMFEHLVRPALERFEACMERASETQHYGEWSERCADGLARYLPRYRLPEALP
ncbi:MAG: hypothetical protein CMN30_26365 [Sandaracinus sp.]|nr:hypothetical protein [Sandaracinus sp.]